MIKKWTGHTGRSNPFKTNTKLLVKLRSGKNYFVDSDAMYWIYEYESKNDNDIIMYKVSERFTDWFNPKNIEHIKAYSNFINAGIWPEGFIPEHIDFGNHNLFEAMNNKLAKAYMESFNNGELNFKTPTPPKPTAVRPTVERFRDNLSYSY